MIKAKVGTNSGFLKNHFSKAHVADAKNEYSKILWEGWIKYFHYETFRTIRKPTEFFVNYQFFSQKVPKQNLKDKDSNGIYNYITTENSFYAVMLPEALNILSEKNQLYTKTVESLDIDLIKPVDPKDPLKGPLTDIGSFDEGDCISVQMLKPIGFKKDFLPLVANNANTKHDSWIICTDTKEEKEKLYTTLMTYRVLRQKEQKISLVIREETKSTLATPQTERYQGNDAQPNLDGYLQLIQDWTKCTLKCGGGESFQQWRCIPPKPGGKPCMGELIRKKKCNETPCPGVQIGSDDADTKAKEKEEEIDFKPIFKSQPFISRPQQDIPCVVRENDVLYEKLDPKTKDSDKKVYVKVPGRLLINNRTIGLFEDNEYDNAVISFNLMETQLNPHKADHCCFYLRSYQRSQMICAMSDCGTKADPKFLNSWKYTFSLFRQKCFRKPDSKALKEKEKGPEKEESLGGLTSMNIDEAEVEEREKVINNKLEEQAEAFVDKKLEKNQQTALKAITRELNLEERLKREEMMKAKDETNILVKKLNFETKKKEKLEEAIEEKEDQEVKVKAQRQVEKQADTILTETEEEINKKRLKLKKKILEIRKMTERRKRLIESKINLVRGKMAQDIVQANKQGSKDTCDKNKDNDAAIKLYCDENVNTDFKRNNDCKDKKNFCYICCETEFGTVQYNKRSECYDVCDKDSAKKEELSKPRGDWIWKVNAPKD